LPTIRLDHYPLLCYNVGSLRGEKWYICSTNRTNELATKNLEKACKSGPIRAPKVLQYS
jgi:hypothetical protein